MEESPTPRATARSPDARALIRTMSEHNPLWGAERIRGELVKLGIDVSQATVAKYATMARRRRPPAQTWRTSLTNHVHRIVAADFFMVATATCRQSFVLVILAHDRGRVVHTAVNTPTAAWPRNNSGSLFVGPSATVPFRDRDRASEAVKATVEAMGIEDELTAPRSPWQNAYAERFIGSVRRESLDQVIVLNAAGLRKILKSYVGYYTTSRTHFSLEKGSPEPRLVTPPGHGRVIAIPQVGGLHQVRPALTRTSVISTIGHFGDR